MATTIMSREQIRQLNDEADRLVKEHGYWPLDAYRKVVTKHRLSFVRYSSSKPPPIGTLEWTQCEIYQASNGQFVSLWISGDRLGFDNQIEDWSMSAQDHRFQMRCSTEFLAVLDRLAKVLGTRDRPEVVRIAVRELERCYPIQDEIMPSKKGRKR